MFLDILFILILLLFTIIGIKVGFFVEFISVFGLFGNFLIAGYMTPLVIDKIKKYYESASYVRGYVIVFVLLYVILMILTSYINMIFKTREKGVITRITGGFLGFAKGLTLVLVFLTVYLLIETSYPEVKKYSKESYVLKIYEDAVEEKIIEHIPTILKEKTESIREERKIKKYLEKLL